MPRRDAAADQALFNAIRTHVKPGLPVVELDCTVNDPAFAAACAQALLAQLKPAAN